METMSTKVHEGTVEEVEEYRQSEGLESRSEAIRRLVRSGLEHDDGPGARTALIYGTTTAGGTVALGALGGGFSPVLGVVGAILWLAGVGATLR